jgi:hypothetical protein
MESLEPKRLEFEGRLNDAVLVERPDRIINAVVIEGAIDVMFKPRSAPGIVIVGDSPKEHAEVTFYFDGDTMHITRKAPEFDMIGHLAKPANLLKSFLRLFGIPVMISRPKTKPMLVCVSQEKVPRLYHNGQGTVLMEGVDQQSLEIRAEGAIDVLASGEVGALGAIMEGGGQWNLSSLQAQTAFLVVDGNGSTEATVHKTLDFIIYGAGSIKVAGNPRVRRDEIKGQGTFEHVGQSEQVLSGASLQWAPRQ